MVTITKEERAALRQLLSACLTQYPTPWRNDGYLPGDIRSADDDYVATCEQFYADDSVVVCDAVIAVINAMPKVLDDLDAMDRALATAREDASEMEKKAIAEGGEALALSLRARGNAPKTYDMMQAIKRGDDPTPEASK